MATCMLLDAGLHKRYWGEAVLTATYIQNRVPSRSVPKTPFEMWWGRKPDLSHMRVFGSQAYVHIPGVKRSKMEPKRLTFVGYSMEHKGYRFVDVKTDSVIISRDARFIELDNGTSSVEIPVSRTCTKEPDIVEIDLVPVKEEDDPVEEEEDPLAEETDAEDSTEEEDAEESEEEKDAEDSTEEEDAEDSAKEEDAEDSAEEPDEPAGDPVEDPAEDPIEAPARNLRRSNRQNRGLPKHLDGFEMQCVVGIAAFAGKEPENHREAFKNPDWRKAMEDEMDSHQRNGTWDLVPLPPGRKPVGSRWVFKIKRNHEDQVVKFKARLVAQGYSQQGGVDFDEVFAPVTRPATLRTFLTVAAKQNLVVQHVDIKTAYLNGILDEEVYMRQPPSFVVPGQEEYVCRLRRSIYGLRQSARCWHKRLNSVLTKLGFKPSSADQCLYIRNVNGVRMLLLVYVDDILLASEDEAELRKVFDSLAKEFELTCLGEIRHFLGLEVQREAGTFKIRLKQYIEKMIVKFGMENSKPMRSPMDVGFLKSSESSEPFEDVTLYRSLVGGLLYLSVMARPDIAASTAILGRKFSEPSQADWTAAKRHLRYLKATSDHYLCLGGAADEPLIGYCDADWAGDPVSRRSTSGFVFMFAGSAVSWASRRQACVTLSSMEAEYVALSEACQETIWLRQLLRDFNEPQMQPTTMKEDNQGCIAFVKTERSSKRSKHIQTRERFVQELCEQKEIALEYCPTEVMIADVMTKALGPQKHGYFVEKLGLEGA